MDSAVRAMWDSGWSSCTRPPRGTLRRRPSGSGWSVTTQRSSWGSRPSVASRRRFEPEGQGMGEPLRRQFVQQALHQIEQRGAGGAGRGDAGEHIGGVAGEGGGPPVAAQSVAVEERPNIPWCGGDPRGARA